MSIFNNRDFEDFFLLYFIFLQPRINNEFILLLSSVLIVMSQNIINGTSEDYCKSASNSILRLFR
jgi:hypothetical protein